MKQMMDKHDQFPYITFLYLSINLGKPSFIFSSPASTAKHYLVDADMQ